MIPLPTKELLKFNISFGLPIQDHIVTMNALYSCRITKRGNFTPIFEKLVFW